ncbi:hypothetical protein ACIQU4_35950 [Streptomyces sp. NPDC090741]|uniref:hypothetical protein n=1 Tax=Streptomyces sp. NPDC090741 TaxID=3365967 RepID=UPI00382BD04A
MSTQAAEVFEGDDRQYSPTRLAGWLQEVNGPARTQPEQLTIAKLAGLPPAVQRPAGSLARQHRRTGFDRRGRHRRLSAAPADAPNRYRW